MGIEVEVAADVHAEVGEGPYWDEASRTLMFVDIPPARVHRLDPADGSVNTIEVGQTVGAIIARASGGWIVAARDGIAELGATGELSWLASIEADVTSNRMNDAKCDPAGRLWAGTMGFGSEPAVGALYRIDTDLRWEQVISDVTISNGLGWSPDGSKMYYIDSPTRQIDVLDYDVATGAATARRRLVSCEDVEGVPDGMAVDAEGHLWVAFFGGGVVRRYDPAGGLVTEIALPAAQITSCAFGGDGLDELYITSAARGLSATDLAEQPHAGAVFRCDPGVRGPLPVPFGG